MRTELTRELFGHFNLADKFSSNALDAIYNFLDGSGIEDVSRDELYYWSDYDSFEYFYDEFVDTVGYSVEDYAEDDALEEYERDSDGELTQGAVSEIMESWEFESKFVEMYERHVGLVLMYRIGDGYGYLVMD